LGSEWRLQEVSIKPLYPCCKYTHGPIEATVSVMKKAGCSIDQVKKLEVRITSKEMYDMVCRPKESKWCPQTIIDAQFSLPFAVATAALNGKVSFSHFNKTSIRDPVVAAVMKRVHLILDFENQGDSRAVVPMLGIVTLRTKSGEIFESKVDYVKGHPKNPVSIRMWMRSSEYVRNLVYRIGEGLTFLLRLCTD